jgi:psp operon transcriptional activator
MTLASHFAVKMAGELGKDVFNGFSDNARRELTAYSWPGNVRELKNVVERAVYSCQDDSKAIVGIVFDPFESPWRPGAQSTSNEPESAAKLPQEPYDFKLEIQEEEKQRIKNAMELCRFNQKKTAEFLGMTYHQLRGYLRKYELTEDDS